jgi:transcriptional regulator with XRE-family HTH domain
MTSQEYLAAVRAKLNITSDYALAKALGVTKQAAGRWSRGLNGFDDDVARRVAEILDIHPGLVMLDIHRERAQTAETKALWQEIFAGFRKLLPHANSGAGVSPAW